MRLRKTSYGKGTAEGRGEVRKREEREKKLKN
jgi:hypothetical protein